MTDTAAEAARLTSLPGQPVDATLLARLGAEIEFDDMRTASHPDTTPLHKAADANYRQMLLVISTAFLRGRKVLRPSLKSETPDLAPALAAIRTSLTAALPSVLLKTVAAGGDAAVQQLRRQLKARR